MRKRLHGMTQGKPGNGLNFEALRLGIERCDPEFLLGFYAEDAKLSIVNADSPRSAPFELHGKAEIAKHLRATFGQEASHRVERDAAVGEDVVASDERAHSQEGSGRGPPT
jgi:hypothetical protein